VITDSDTRCVRALAAESGCYENGGPAVVTIGVRDLAAAIGLSRRSTQRCLRRLERDGFLFRTDPGGGRGNFATFRLTAIPR
jgi:DNA-binding Lrp family transcriptional regulator